MSRLVAVRFPTLLPRLGIGLPARLAPLVVVEGEAAWAWDPDPPDLPIATFIPPRTTHTEAAWGVDHVVVTVPDLSAGIETLVAAGVDFRRTGLTARGQNAAFFLAGPVIEVIEVPGSITRLAGVAFETDLVLEVVAGRWAAAGLEPTTPHDAVQPGRRIMSLKGHRVAVMDRRALEDRSSGPSSS